MPDGWCEGVFASPAVGDVTATASLMWCSPASTGTCGRSITLVRHSMASRSSPTTPWSSPALFDVDADGDLEIFIGGDSTPGGPVDHLGSVLWALDVEPAASPNSGEGLPTRCFIRAERSATSTMTAGWRSSSVPATTGGSSVRRGTICAALATVRTRTDCSPSTSTTVRPSLAFRSLRREL